MADKIGQKVAEKNWLKKWLKNGWIYWACFFGPKLQATVSIEGVQKLVVIRNNVAIWDPLGRVGKSGLRGGVRRSRSWQNSWKFRLKNSGWKKVDEKIWLKKSGWKNLAEKNGWIFWTCFFGPKLPATVSIEGVQKLAVIRNYVAIWGPPRLSRTKWSQRGSTQVQKVAHE